MNSIKFAALAAMTLQSAIAHAVTAPGFDIRFNYGYDSNNFFADQARKDALEAAAAVFESRFTDSLSAIESSGQNIFTTVFDHPSSPSTQISLASQVIPAGVVQVYVGAAAIGNALGIGNSGGYACRGAASFCSDAYLGRGQGATRGANPVDFAPWGGSMTFNSQTNWNFGVNTGPAFSQFDFYSVAVHELAHLLGFGTANSFSNLVFNGAFKGPTAGTVALATEGGNWTGHWVSGTQSTYNGLPQETAMDPDIANGQRKYFTDLDFAAMDDIGWEVTPVPEADTWAMLLAGLGLVGFAARRRARV